jgi:predicted metal-binding protein
MLYKPMGYCQKCGAFQLYTNVICRYNELCGGKVLLPQEKPEDPLVTFAKNYCKFEASFESSFNGVISGATWQKNQDRQLIQELMEALELANATFGSCIIMRKNLCTYLNMDNIYNDRQKLIQAISKAETFLKK